MRKCANWIDFFCEYIDDTETPKIFAKWSAISAIASALRRKCVLVLGRQETFPNLYIVFVGPPAKVVKSTSIDYMCQIINELPFIHFSAESNTRESLFQNLEASRDEFVNIDGSLSISSNLTVISKEFEIFLGQKKENSKLLIALTDLYDGKFTGARPWKHSTKHSGCSTIPLPFLNIIGGTTPDSLSRGLSSDAIGDGFTTRIIFVYQDQRPKDVPRPSWTKWHEEARENLIYDLNEISKIIGTYTTSEECNIEYDKWYVKQRHSPKICQDQAFAGWYERKPLLTRKVAMIYKASYSDEKLLVWSDFTKAIEFIEEVEHTMALSFRGVGRSDITIDVDMAYTIISSRSYISDSDLLALTWRDMDSQKMDAVITTLTRSGKIRMLTRSPTGEAGLFYVAVKPSTQITTV